MKLTKIKIQNFQCYGPKEEEILIDNFTTLIGANNSGKTATLKALEKLFGISRKSRIITKLDFHIPKEELIDSIDSLDLNIETVFTFPELIKEKERNEHDEEIAAFFKHCIVDDPGGIPYVRIRLEAKWNRSQLPEGEIDYNLKYILSPENTPKDEEKTERIPHNMKGAIQMVYVPALRNPSKQLKNATGTIIWRLMQYVSWSKESKKIIMNKINELNSIFSENIALKDIEESINYDWNNFNDIDFFSKANLEFSTNEFSELLKKIGMNFQPGPDENKLSIEQIGDGLRSLFYISLVCSLLRIEKRILFKESKSFINEGHSIPFLTIVCIEEPENHLAPHLLGRIMENLLNLTDDEIAQVIITSHSPSILKRVDPENIRYLRINLTNNTTKVMVIDLPIKEEEAFKYVKEAVRSYPELYFSKVVILVEGDSEILIIPRIFEIPKSSIDRDYISVVPLGGKYVNHFWKLLNSLEIPNITLLDFDIYKKIIDPIEYICKELKQYRDDIIIGGKNLNEINIGKLNNLSVEKKLRVIKILEKYDIFFSYPLDFDYLMLLSFSDEYKKIYESKKPKGGEPNVIKHKGESDYETKLNNYVKSNFSSDFDIEKSIFQTIEEKELLAWHKYLFSDNKPAVHFLFISQIEPNILEKRVPDVIKRMRKKILKILE